MLTKYILYQEFLLLTCTMTLIDDALIDIIMTSGTPTDMTSHDSNDNSNRDDDVIASS